MVSTSTSRYASYKIDFLVKMHYIFLSCNRVIHFLCDSKTSYRKADKNLNTKKPDVNRGTTFRAFLALLPSERMIHNQSSLSEIIWIKSYTKNTKGNLKVYASKSSLPYEYLFIRIELSSLVIVSNIFLFTSN